MNNSNWYSADWYGADWYGADWWGNLLHGGSSKGKKGKDEALHRKRLLREDEELIAIVIGVVTGGVLQ